MSQQAVSAIIIQCSARLPISWLSHKFRSLKTLGPLFLMTFPFLTLCVEFFANFSYSLHFAKFVCLLCHQSPLFSPTPGPQYLTIDSLSRYFKTGYREKLGLVWRNRKKISQIINGYLFLPFFLFFILWAGSNHTLGWLKIPPNM